MIYFQPNFPGEDKTRVLLLVCYCNFPYVDVPVYSTFRMLLLLPVCYCSRMFYFPYVKEHELLDKVFFFVKLRIIYSTTQASAISIPIFVPKRCRTARYQNSFFIRKARISNPLTGRMELAIATLTGFKSLLYDYDSRAVRMNYNLDNPQTFKTICLKCDSTRFS